MPIDIVIGIFDRVRLQFMDLGRNIGAGEGLFAGVLFVLF